MSGDAGQWGDYYDDAYRRLDAVRKRLYDEFPEIERVLQSGVEAPPLRLLCPPKGHRIITVVLDADHNWNPFLMPVRDESFEAGHRVAHAAAPLGVPREDRVDDVSDVKVLLECPRRDCPYSGVHRQERLLKVYAAFALRLGLHEVRLPA